MTFDGITSERIVSAPRYEILVLTACLSVALLLLGGWLTYLGLGPWYEGLNFPPFQPPSWLFTPVWTIVLSLLAWATWSVGRHEHRGKGVGLAFALYGAQCILNVGWSLLFFTLKRPDVALWELLALDAVLLLMVVAYARVTRSAGLLLVPYFVWLLYATAINAWIVQFNTPFGSAATVQSSSGRHVAHMQQAIELAHQNPLAPFGSVLVDRRTDQVVAAGVNQSAHNPTLHGEIAAINDYASRGKADWSQLTLYTTAEPCCMCQGAILWAGIREVVFGTSIAQLKALGWKQIDIRADEVVSRSWDKNVRIVGGVLATQCDQLFLSATSSGPDR